MLNSDTNKAILFSSALLCIMGCITDLVLIYTFGNQIPGYNQLTYTISQLGVSTSPVSEEVTVWAVILGILFIFFGLAFKAVFKQPGRNTLIAALLIIIYGLGEDIASGIFKADRVEGALTLVAIIHNLLGGMGVIAVLLLPWVMMKIFTRETFPAFYRFSVVVWIIGVIFILLFSCRMVLPDTSFLRIYNGLWQRIFLADYYVYFITIALMMMKHIYGKPRSLNNGV